MVDREVEATLREIRERVRAETGLTATPRAGRPGGSGAEASAATPWEVAPDALARLEANLATAGRAWDRLPPLVSSRGGWLARVELWVKRRIKRVTHWYTWEQVNFNAAVQHSLRDVLAALTAYERRLSELHDSLREATEGLDSRLAALDARLAPDGELRNEQREQVGHVLEEQRVCFRQLSLEAGEAAVTADRARRQTEARLAELEKAVMGDK